MGSESLAEGRIGLTGYWLRGHERKQYWNNWKNDMSLFSATNQERPSGQLHNLANLLLLRFFLSKGGREGSRLLRVAIAIFTLFLRLGRVVSNCTIKLFSGDPIASSINNFLIDHNEPTLFSPTPPPPPPKNKCITIVSNFTWVLNRRQWLCKILGCWQGALWSMLKWWIDYTVHSTGAPNDCFQ